MSWTDLVHDWFEPPLLALVNTYIAVKLLCAANNALVLCVQVIQTLRKKIEYQGASADPNYVPLGRLGKWDRILCLTWGPSDDVLNAQRDLKWWLRWNGGFWRHFQTMHNVHDLCRNRTFCAIGCKSDENAGTASPDPVPESTR